MNAELHIHLENIKHNYLYAKNIVKNQLFAVVKTNAYGLGVDKIATYLNDFIDGFAVATFDEALHLKSINIKKPILIMMGCFNHELDVAIKNNFISAITTTEQAQNLLNIDIRNPLKIFLKYDSGMSRLGLNKTQFIKYYQEFKKNNNIDITLMSHFCCSESVEQSQDQVKKINNLKQKLNIKTISCNNSAGILNQLIDDSISRMGISLYGVDNTNAHTLKPAISLFAPIIAIKYLNKGDGIGYGQTYQCDKNTTIAVVKIGYGDGYPRSIKPNTPVFINNHKTVIIGRVSMDMITIDITNLTAKIGDRVELFGESIPVETVAQSANTIAYEIFCNISSRVKRTILT